MFFSMEVMILRIPSASSTSRTFIRKRGYEVSKLRARSGAHQRRGAGPPQWEDRPVSEKRGKYRGFYMPVWTSTNLIVSAPSGEPPVDFTWKTPGPSSFRSR